MRRYKLPIMITENGLADSSDVLRPAYILEHMVAIGQAIEDGIPISGSAARGIPKIQVLQR